MAKKKKKVNHFVSEASIPAGVYPELDHDLGRSGAKNDIPAIAPGLWSGTDGTSFPVGPAFGTDLAWDNMGNDIPAADLEDLRQDPRLR